MKRLLALVPSFFAAICPAVAVPGTATLTLVDEPGFNEITLGVAPPLLPSDSDVSTLTGTVEVLLEIDPETDQVSEMTILSGTLNGSPVSLSGSIPFVGNYNFSSTTLGADLDTPLPPGLVEPATGEFDGAQHTFTVNSGTLSGNVTVTFPSINEMLDYDFGAEPLGGPATGTGTIALAATGNTPTSKSYEVTLELPIEIMDAFVVPDTTLTVDVEASGTVKAVGPMTIEVTPPNPYTAWTESNGIADAPFDGDENGDGVPNGLQWALGLAASEPPLPYLLQPVGDMGATVDFTVTLPMGGSAADLFVLVSDDPESAPFAPLASGSVSAGNPIPAGTSGVVTIALPKDTIGFVRLSVAAPAP